MAGAPRRDAQRREGWLTVEGLLAAARDDLDRMTPAQAIAAQKSGAALVDIRSEAQRARDGEIPGATRHPRNVLEWRLDPACAFRDRDLARHDRRVILVCDEGFQSSLAAATAMGFGLDATDVIGGFQAWRAAGLPVAPYRAPPGPPGTSAEDRADRGSLRAWRSRRGPTGWGRRTPRWW
jgi:rhodanese-related sulfurtransferase